MKQAGDGREQEGGGVGMGERVEGNHETWKIAKKRRHAA